tara:strand:+ start:4957 stop:6369 length:1413 start_codon:yes stop_codon:yes gene_type:complete
MTIGKLRKLAGIVQSSESLSTLLGEKDKGRKPKKPKPVKHKKRDHVPKVKPKVEKHRLPGDFKGCLCQACQLGKLYKTEPATLLRIIGQSPFQPINHVMERLRCNRCGEYVTASLPPDVTADGGARQKYGYSARSLMAIAKFFGGSPYYRQGSLQDLFGVSITASTIFDQVEYVANDAFAVYSYLAKVAADARYFQIDDTRDQILDQKPVIKASRSNQAKRLRSGVYTSGMIATLDEGHDIILFQTNIGHSGEFLDDVLAKRQVDSLPIIMSDALSSNACHQHQVIESVCNSHARRNFYDIHSHFAEEIEWVIGEYSKIWVHEALVVENEFSPALRLEYHQTHSLPVMKSIQAWGNKHLDDETAESNSALGEAIAYFNNHFEKLTAFCRVEGALIDNNRMEMILKIPIRDRKNGLFHRTLAGASVADVITSLIATAYESGVNVFDYFNWLQRERELVKKHPERYLPWLFK